MPIAKKKVSTKVSRDQREWLKWKKSAELFARGKWARVYRKKETGYPRTYHSSKGNLVKIYSDNKSYRQIFWGLKIAYALFPENVVKVRAFRKTTSKYQEIHVEEVPLNKELIGYLDLLKRTGKHDFNSPEYKKLLRVTKKSKKEIDAIDNILEKAGFERTENASNISLADPRKPVLIEPEIINPERLVDFILDSGLPIRKIRKILNYFERWQKASEPV